MSNPISSIIFAYRNVDKTQKGEIGRAPVAAAQSMNVLGELAKYNKLIAKGANATTSFLEKYATKSDIVRYSLNGVNWATKNVNPLICISGGAKVIMSDNKLETGINEACSLSTMFAGEAIAKEILPKIVKKLPVGSKVGGIIKGLLFVGASIGSYSLGSFIGKDITRDLTSKLGVKSSKIDQIA